MSDTEADGGPEDRGLPHLTLEYDLDAPPDRVWRAISVPEFREAWLPARDLADEKPISSEPGRQVGYRLREAEPPFLESVVTFQLRPNADGGTRLRIVHGLTGAGNARPLPLAANNNRRDEMRAA
ncbi:polyketide cyclase [Tistrella bauzanensis]|uniref:Polyketide cyclase n=1 Tax=Tistrella bauzanensis TaxID=657419 RepID=A0ABQ1IJP6_9PROT|nr:polyketide cyclase [Tistrella bauzanensis]GGB43953.1 polyketide cyclase [Tistrella bauzanensis]